MALISDRNAPRTRGEIISLPVAASTKIFAGGLVAINSNGYLVPASDTVGLKVIGVADEAVDNSNGANGDVRVKVSRCAVKFGNSATHAVTQVNVGSVVFVEDEGTVASQSTNSVPAGLAIELEADGVWVDVSCAPYFAVAAQE